MQADIDVAIIGAGAAGLTLAIELARHGVDAQIFEQRSEPFQGSRGKGLQPRTLEIFEALGVVDRLFARGGPYPPGCHHHADGSRRPSPTAETRPPQPDEPYGAPLMVPQSATEAVLRERLAETGRHVQWDHELIALQCEDDATTLRLATPSGQRSWRARYLVAADGGRSFVRKALAIGFPGSTLGVRAVVADVELHGLERTAWHHFNEDAMAQRISLCPLQGTALFQLQAPIPLEGEVDLSADGLQAMLHQRTGRHDLRLEAVHWASAYRMSARLADRYRQGRVFLVGDAAHVHPPTGGQGLNTSVQDAYNLGWKLASVLKGAPDTLLESYESERRPIAADVLGLSTHLLEQARRGDNRRGREVQQLELGYRSSPLASPWACANARIRPGDRAPDAPLLGAAGQPRRLFQVLAGPHWTLLGQQPPADAPAAPAGLPTYRIGPAHELRDAEGHFARAYGLASGQWVLVRPDGYVAAVATSAQRPALDQWWRTLLGAPT